MRTICVMSSKGGTGKSTVSTSLSLAAHLRGLSVVLADVDPQHSSHYALRSRATEGPKVEATTGGKLFPMKGAAELRRTDLFLIDTPAGLDAAVYQGMAVADLCLVVTRPNYLDLAAALTTTNVLRQLGKRALIVLNQVPTSRDGLEAPTTAKARDALRFVRYPVAEAVLCSRTAFVRAVAAGESVEEFAPQSPAAQEVGALWDEVSAVIGFRKSPRMRWPHPPLGGQGSAGDVEFIPFD